MGVADGSVLLGYVHDGWVRAEFMRSVRDAEKDARIGRVEDASAGSLIPKARNLLVRKFLDSGLDWLWTVDTDVVFSAGALPALAAVADPDDRPVVSGIVPILRPDGSRIPSLFAIHDEAGDLSSLRFAPVDAPPPSEIVEVDACGAACLLVHREVFEKVETSYGPAWFNPTPVPRGLVGDDLSFCLRARAVGVRFIATGAVRAGHLKTVKIGDVIP